MMLWGGATGDGLELRATRGGGARLAGRFPYGTTATLSDGGRRGRPRKERIGKRAFRYRVETPDPDGGKQEIHLLSGHDYGRPLASVRSGTLELRDTDEALSFEAEITAEIAETTHARDALALIRSGLAVGISPGFRIPPSRAVPVAEEITEEPNAPEQGQHRAIIRTVLDALLYELSIVTRPAYPEAQVEARSWERTGADPAALIVPAHLRRWRA